jgi:hypothetical protein
VASPLFGDWRAAAAPVSRGSTEMLLDFHRFARTIARAPPE